VLLSLIAWAGSLLLGLEHAGELLNFGALLGFMGVNLAALRHGYFLKARADRRVLLDAVPPILGFLFCLAIWVSLPVPAKALGGLWLALGIGYYALRSRREPSRIVQVTHRAARSGGG
jgi:hypothetical protein